MKVYVPPQHTAKPYGCEHETVFASIELWVDELPDAMDVGGILWWRGRGADSVSQAPPCDNDPSD